MSRGAGSNDEKGTPINHVPASVPKFALRTRPNTNPPPHPRPAFASDRKPRAPDTAAAMDEKFHNPGTSSASKLQDPFCRHVFVSNALEPLLGSTLPCAVRRSSLCLALGARTLILDKKNCPKYGQTHQEFPPQGGE